MSDANIPALLEELWEVDFETYVCFLRLKSASRGEIQDIEAMELIDHDIIQGCIQRAIAARGWEYQVAYNPHIGPDGRHGQAYIWPLSEVTKCYESEEDTPAAAILAAYIEAVRARQ